MKTGPNDWRGEMSYKAYRWFYDYLMTPIHKRPIEWPAWFEEEMKRLGYL